MATAPRREPARWAVWAAWAAVVCVIPSGLWRTAVGLGADLGWSQEQLDSQQIPGSGTTYVVSLTVLSVAAAALTLGLVKPWGERLPPWVPGLGGARVPVAAAVVLAVTGAALVLVICAMSVIRWDDVSGFADQPDSRWQWLMVAAYAPALSWGPLLLAVTFDYWRRRAA